MIEKLLDEASRLTPTAFAAIGIFLAFWLVSSLVRKLLRSIGARAEPGKEDVFNLLGQIARVTLLITGFITALGTLGVNVTAMVAGLGLTGFALGFALKDALSNLLAGIFLLIYRPFKRGDQIKVEEFSGTVIGIDLRYTTLQETGQKILIPNSVLFTSAITLNETEKQEIRPVPAVQTPGSETPDPDRASPGT
ncbi:MAG: mechanosensitive ion channel family protein [Pseudomonadota bacterium]